MNQPRAVFHLGVSVRVAPRSRLFLGLATGRYWSTGARHDRTCTELRLPFLSLGIIHGTVLRFGRISFMGWRGIDHRPRPALRVWQR